MRVLIDLFLLLVAIGALVPACVLFVELVAAPLIVRRNGAPVAGDASIPTVAVLMPAHDEARGIESTIRELLPQLRACDRLLVVADNCSDATAIIARTAGAEVIERLDASRRGKGYALDCGVRWLELDPPDVVVVIDADCAVAPQGLGILARQCRASGRPVQALYLMRAPSGAPVRARIAEFAWIVKNKARPLGGAALGWPCQLMGTGMAFPWSVAKKASLASGHLTEDLELGVKLAATGDAPAFCPEVLVSSVFPADHQAGTSQRMRWEHGHLSVLLSLGPRLLWRSLIRRDGKLAAMILDLMVPPLAALVLLLAGFMFVAGLNRVLGGSGWPLAVGAGAMGLTAVGVTVAWLRHGSNTVSLWDLLGLPLYVVSKVPVYIRLVTKRQVEWVRTKRDEQRH